MLRRLLQRAGFFEQMGRIGNQGKLLLAVHQRISLLVQFDHAVVSRTDNEQRRCTHAAQGELSCKVRTPAARNHCRDLVAHFCCGLQRRSRTGARTEITQMQRLRIRFGLQPRRGRHQAAREQRDVEARLVILILFLRQQIEKQGSHAVLLQHLGDIGVARTETAAAAAVREQHYTAGRGRDDQLPVKFDRAGRYSYDAHKKRKVTAIYCPAGVAFAFIRTLCLMLLDVAAKLARIVRKLTFGRIEAIAQSHVDVFGMVAVNHDLAACHADIDAHVEMLSLLMVLVRHLDNDPARHDVIKELIEFFYFIAYASFQSF